ncbi:hypothetical protein RUM44_009681 [Polyplax serrata]|uniref:Uncharacterized protein n=1 Tax=Polyplax serrata TaxID=468196 RepID=A0ABR1ATD9_POLSC
MSDSSSIEDEILLLYSRGDWETILDKFDRNRFLPWIWPSKENLEFIGNWARQRRSNSIVSVGCGSGFFEWLLEMATGVKVTGVEIKGIWWNSKYSSGSFIPLLLVDETTRSRLEMNTENSILLFCYFNNLNAFLDYVNSFMGNCLIVIGPGPGRGTYTIPEPFHLPEETPGKWEFVESQELRSSKDHIAVYIRTL